MNLKTDLIFDRNKLEEIEDRSLAPYGFRSRDSRGRDYPDDEPTYRTLFQRDRDRILHTTAFRRLEYKTQVFIITEGDYYRTRLTHTLEVAQLGRTIARALGANEDLVEAICLAHDLGHPPFGHAGEEALNRMMEGHGGFEHNRQSFRIVTLLDKRFPDFPGLNLTWEVREGMVKHETEYDISVAEGYDPELRGHLEAQIANAADELAYTSHDLDDGLRSGLLLTDQLEGLDLWTMLLARAGLKDNPLDDLTRHRLVRRLIGIEVSDLVQTTAGMLEMSEASSVESLQKLPHNVVGHSDNLKSMNRQLKIFLYEQMYRHPRVDRMKSNAERVLEDLFTAFVEEPELLPQSVALKFDDFGIHRSICDYLAGMTDRFALSEHSRLIDLQVQI